MSQLEEKREGDEETVLWWKIESLSWTKNNSKNSFVDKKTFFWFEWVWKLFRVLSAWDAYSNSIAVQCSDQNWKIKAIGRFCEWTGPSWRRTKKLNFSLMVLDPLFYLRWNKYSSLWWIVHKAFHKKFEIKFAQHLSKIQVKISTFILNFFKTDS